MHNRFFIIGLPRSGTAWLSNFFTWEDSFCYHEGMHGHTDVAEYRDMLDSNPASMVGDSDTGLTLYLPWMMDIFPRAKYVFIKRDKEDVARSCVNKGFSTSQLDEGERALQWGIDNIPALIVPFNTLFENIEVIWDYIGLDNFPVERYELLKHMKIDEADKFLKNAIVPAKSFMNSFIRESIPWQ